MTTFTNSKLTDEYVSNATLIRLILWADQHNSHYVVAALRELQERRKADSVPVEINDDMAYAFHHALSDSSPGADEVEEIKAGVRAAFANVTTQPAPVVPEFETWFNSQESGRSICSTQIRRSLQEISWNACCAAMLQGKSEQPQNAQQNIPENIPGGNSPVIPDGWISCSERMPNDAQWCVVNTEYGYYVQCWSEGQGWLGDDISIPECDVINWMPLPEPPQEVK
ncbi:TPA: DUF551 domain-containing protein [Escherichia coli]|uniref:DUF551 domain-containing protein n=1 Tax=Escherichia coli TaxID=562 RepID=UPI001988B6BA|nr:DUF551 domain-containing protein [Escherichia coli]EHY0668612.1 DUF551 domain-containing protein [Escherichia coli]EJI2133975.1 DUF551 domain-containing protein [Escherichia coli]EKT6165670.1 DUF551 domain-containing protein [Escherichia coli]ELK6808255.1 DUF551 domain-containing protein [Escherichia coli]